MQVELNRVCANKRGKCGRERDDDSIHVQNHSVYVCPFPELLFVREIALDRGATLVCESFREREVMIDDWPIIASGAGEGDREI